MKKIYFLILGMFFLISFTSAYNLMENSNTEHNIKTTLKDNSLQISKWNESSIFVSLPSWDSFLNDKENIVTLDYEDYSGRFYMKNEDTFEWEIILDKKPKSNIFVYNVSMENLECFKQLPLVDEEEMWEEYFGFDLTCNDTDCWNEKKENLVHRPINIVNSYSCYHDSKSNGEYKTGKAFQIERILVIDNEGKESWGDIDLTKDNLTIIISKEFLENAIYPLTIDPYIGYTSGGSSDSAYSNYDLIVNWWLEEEPGEMSIDSAHAYSRTLVNSGTNQLKVHTYSKGADVASSDYHASSGTTSVTSTSLEWLELSMSGDFSASTDYIVAFQPYNDVNYRVRVAYDSGSWGDEKHLSDNDFTPPSTLTGASTQSTRMSVYVNYSSGSGEEDCWKDLGNGLIYVPDDCLYYIDSEVLI